MVTALRAIGGTILEIRIEIYYVSIIDFTEVLRDQPNIELSLILKLTLVAIASGSTDFGQLMELLKFAFLSEFLSR